MKFNFLGKRKEPEQPAKKEQRAGGILSRDVIIDSLYAKLDEIPDVDSVLVENGITRGELGKCLRDEDISTALETRINAVLACPWRLDGQDETKPAKILHKHLSGVIEQLVTDVWSAVPFGFSLVETVWGPCEGGQLFGVKRLSKKPVDWFSISREGVAVFNAPQSGIPKPLTNPHKFLLTRRQASWENPYGEGLLTRLYMPYFFRHHLPLMWMKYLERFGDPLLTAKGQNPADMADDLLALGFESVAAVGQDDEINVLTNSGSGEFERAAQYLGNQVSKVVLGQTLTTSVASTGSFAAAKVHNEVREDRRNADIRMVSKTVQTLVNSIWEVNRFPGDAPVFVMEDETGLETERAERDSKLMDSGVKLSPDYFKRAYDYQPEEIIGVGIGVDYNTPEDQESTEAQASGGLTLSEGQKFTENQKRMEGLVSELINSGEQVGFGAEKLQDVVEGSESIEQLLEALEGLKDGLSDQSEALAMAGFEASVVGFVASDRGER